MSDSKMMICIVCLLGVLFVALGLANGEAENLYPAAMVVVAVDASNDVVTIESWSGLRYQFEGIEDWQLGDLAALIMGDNDTPESVLDDVIIKVQYGGFINLSEFLSRRYY